jgi:hypothetical protein
MVGAGGIAEKSRDEEQRGREPAVNEIVES